MTLEMLAAKHGDCLILRCGTPEAPKLVLIDGGPAGVWRDSLKPRLMEIRAERGLENESQTLAIDLLIISHVDDDHINGVLGLLEFIHDRVQGGLPPLFKISRIWHNSFDTIVGNDETLATLTRQFGPASLGADISEGLRDHEAGSPRDARWVLASVKQGDDVRRLAGVLKIPINPDFGGGLIQAGAPGPGSPAAPVAVGGVEFIVVGPLHADVVALQEAHDAWLREHPERRADATALLSALDDKAVANLSSIVLLARHGDKTLLLTGDARADKVLAGLETTGLIAAGGTFAVDILKLPHHGSIRNIDPATMTRLPAATYAFSGSGKFGNPDRETFDLLFALRPGAPMKFILSYELDFLDEGRKADREAERRKRPATPAWDEAKHALKAVLSPPPQGTTVTESTGKFIAVNF